MRRRIDRARAGSMPRARPRSPRSLVGLLASFALAAALVVCAAPSAALAGPWPGHLGDGARGARQTSSSACSSYTGNAAFVCAVYEDILFRAPDSGGLDSWTSQLASGTTRTQVAYGIVDSTESLTDYIDGDYLFFLGRQADPGGLDTWLAAFRAGASVEQVDAGVIGSAEFFSDSGSTNSGFLNAVYEDLLGRPIDSSGSSTWSSALADGASRTQVAYAIDTSNEEYTDDVQSYYQEFLDRSADPAGLSFWVGALESGATDQQVIAAILGSQEFYDDVAGG